MHEDVANQSKRMMIAILVAWFLFPLGGGTLGLILAFVGPALPYLESDFTQLVAWGMLGTVAGAMIATVHTAYTYWRVYLR